MWRDRKLTYLVEKKSEIIENIVCIKLFLCPYYKIYEIIPLQSLKNILIINYN